MDESMIEFGSAGVGQVKRKVLFKDFPFGWENYDGLLGPITDEERKILSEIDKVFEETFKCPSR